MNIATKQHIAITAPVCDEVPFQPASMEIWASKYALKSNDGTPLEHTLDQTYHRVATALAGHEGDPIYWTERFLWALRNGAIPAGRIMSNAGAAAHKTAVSLINCTVSATLRDSMADILLGVVNAGLTLKAGCGIGYDFSTLRPKGALVAGAGASTSGPLPFMDIFNSMCATVSSAGGRRGAQMATFHVSHPDVVEFIQAKRQDGRLRQFNCSLLVPDAFMDQVAQDGYWNLVFPYLASEREELAHAAPEQIQWMDWPVVEQGYTVAADGKVACKVYATMRARELFNLMLQSNYDYAEPGIIFIDRVNAMNNLWFCENIRATNPCGEQPLPPNGSCLLGSINLTKFVLDPFTPQARFDWDRYLDVVAVFTRMLDNVADMSGLPLPEQTHEILDKRRHGMGFLGLGSALAMLTIRYGTPEAVAFTERVTREMALMGWLTGVALAKEKGSAPALERKYAVTGAMLRRCPELAKKGFAEGELVTGKELLTFSGYMQALCEHQPHIREQIIEHGCRFTHHTSIAPTGTISLSLANNASNGIEPTFAQHYSRNVIKAGKKTKEKVDVFSYELLAYRTLVNPDATPDADDDENRLPDYFVDADRLTPAEHVAMQAAAQRYVDSAISKTTNVATDIAFEEFSSVYSDAHAAGLKGCTTFRFNPAAFQGVLVKESDLNNTTYQFHLEDGTVVEARGNEQIEYDGELHSAANLFDALKEGQYGTF